MSNAPVAPTMKTNPQLLQMTPAQRAAYYRNLGPQGNRAAAQYRAWQLGINRTYMRQTIRNRVVMPQQAGGALSQAWALGQTLNFTVPTGINQYVEGFWLRHTLTVNPATGTGAAYALNAMAPFSLYDQITIQYNGQLHRFPLFVLEEYNRHMGYLRPPVPFTPVAGQVNSTLQAYRNTGTPITVNTANVWTHQFFIPLTLLGPNIAQGMLPAMGGETPVQVQLQCASQVMGPDPLRHTIANTGGTGASVAVAGTVQMYAAVRNGRNYQRPAPLPVDVFGLPIPQAMMDTPLTGITAGTTYTAEIQYKAPIRYMALYIVDGNQSNRVSSWTNLQSFFTAPDATGANAFQRFGTGTNMSLYEMFMDDPLLIGQDTDEGVINVINSRLRGAVDPDDQDGNAFLNTGKAGFLDFHYGVQLGSIGGVAGITPRVEAFVILENPKGLTIG